MAIAGRKVRSSACRKVPIVAALLLAWSLPLHAGGDAARPRLHLGKVYEIDRKVREIVITHGDLPEFGMPPMTMGFRVKDARLLDKVRPGDKVRFRAELVDGVITLTGIERLR